MDRLRRMMSSFSQRGMGRKSLSKQVVERLEARALLSASIGVQNLTSETASHNVTVTYTDPDGIDLTTIDATDLTVAGGASPVTVSLVGPPTGSATEVVATYALAGPGGGWDAADNAEYTLAVAADAVKDLATNNLDAGDAKTLSVDIPVPDTTAPATQISVGNVTAGADSVVITVVYTDSSGINAGTIDTSDLAVSRVGGGETGGTLTILDAEVLSTTADSATAVYTFRARGGTWDTDDNADYNVTLSANAVQDSSPAANGNAAGSAGFTVNIPDLIAPTASITAGDVAAAAASHTITVTYTDETALNVSTIDVNDVQVSRTGSADAVQVTDVSTQASSDNKTITATYTLAGPTGGFDAADNGAYAVALAGGAVLDAAGNAATASPASFAVNITPTVGLGGPVAVITAPNITTPGGATQTVTVVYTDVDRIRVNTIDLDDLVVSNGSATLQAVDVSATSTLDLAGNRLVTAVYTLAAPGGAWDTPDNGTYTITLAENAVTDSKANGNAAAAATFTVDATVPDTAAPTASAVTAADVTTEGVTAQVVTVTYSDDVGIDLSSIGPDDLTVTGPGGALAVTVINVAGSADGKSATVAYTLATPDGGFTSQNGGAYTIAIPDGAVLDTAGKGIAAASGSFQVNVPPPPVIDPTFGAGNAGNTVLTTFTAEAVSTDATGRLLVVGRSGTSAVLERRNVDGSLDTSFNGNGQIVSTTDTAYYAVVVQGDKIVVAGNAGGDLVVARYTADGKLDTTFGTAGRTVVDFNAQPNDVAFTLAVTPTGGLVAAGQSNGDFALARFTAEGALDTTFAQTGIRTFDAGGAADLAGSVIVLADGKVLVAGTSDTSVAVARFLADGSPDASFSGDGLLVVPGLVAVNGPTDFDRSIALALEADGDILVGNRTAGDDFGVVRVDATGDVDSGFGSGGLASIDFGGSDDADQIFLQPTGEIVVLGTSLAGGVGSVTLAALDSGGDLITAFGDGGKLVLESAPVATSAARELHLGDLVLRAFGTRQADGRIVLGSSSNTPQQSQSVLRRVSTPGVSAQPDGTLLGNFGFINGKATKFSHTLPDGKVLTFTIRGGIGSAFLGADGRINLRLTEDSSSRGAGVTAAVKARGGDRRVTLGDVTVNGSVDNVAMKTGDVSGTFCVTGTVNKLVLGNVGSGAAICAAGSMKSVTLASLTNARVLAGTNLGTNGEFGGTGAAGDSYAAANIGRLKVAGQIVGSTVAAGLDPVDATFLDDDDRLAGEPSASFINSITAAAADGNSRFVSAGFGKAKLGSRVSVSTDQRFRVLQ